MIPPLKGRYLTGMTIRKKILLTFMSLTLGVCALFLGYSILNLRYRLQANLGYELVRIARTATPFINGDEFELIRLPADTTGPIFQKHQQELINLRNAHYTSEVDKLTNENIYTIRRVGDKFFFVTMPHARPFTGDPVPENEISDRIRRQVLDSGMPAATGVYEDSEGGWISAVSPILNSQGKIVGLLEINYRYDTYFTQFLAGLWVYALLATLIPLVLLIAGLLISRNITRPLEVIDNRIISLTSGQGDLTRKMNIEGADEISRMAGHIDEFIESIRKIIIEVQEFSEKVYTAAARLRKQTEESQDNNRQEVAMIENTSSANEELTASIKEIQNKTERQAKTIADVFPSLENLLGFIGNVETNAGKVNQTLQMAQNKVSDGQQIISHMTDSINQISDSSADIRAIVEIIEDIADKIALLSLNASIEAARAGEYGKGFAIVAEEVSKLSDVTTRQIKDISEIVKRNSELTRGAVSLVQDSKSTYDTIQTHLKGSLELSGANTKAALANKEPARQGLSVLTNISDISQEIAHALKEQSLGTEEVSQSMMTLNQITDTNALGSQDIHLLAHTLESLVVQLGESLEKLKA